MIRKAITICCMGLLLGWPGTAPSQDTTADSAAYKQTIDDLFSGEPGESEQSAPMPVVPQGVTLDDMDEETREKYFEALRGHFEYRIGGYKHRQNVFHWQLLSSKIIFVVVIFLVTAGIYFSWVQFHSFLKMKEAGAAAESEITELEASARGIKISSPVLGVIILVISLLFFYLYLVHIYPIREIF